MLLRLIVEIVQSKQRPSPVDFPKENGHASPIDFFKLYRSSVTKATVQFMAFVEAFNVSLDVLS